MMDRESLRFPWEDDDAGTRPAPEAAPPRDAPAVQPPEDAAAGTPAPAAEAEPAAPGEPDGEEQAGAEASPPVALEPPAADAARRAAPAAPRRGDPVARPVVRKEYYSISEVADLVGLPAHVLRYWESQFAVLNPSKNRSGNRVYQRKEIRLILLVKQLLHDEKYTVEGARQKLDQLRRGGGLAATTGEALDQQLVQALRDDLQRVSELLRVEGD